MVRGHEGVTSCGFTVVREERRRPRRSRFGRVVKDMIA